MKRILSGFIILSVLFTVSAGGNKQTVKDAPPETRAAGSHDGNETAVEARETALVGAGIGGADSVFPRHEPHGTGIGVYPGRVAWAYNPQSVDWDGEGYWWKLNHFNEAVIQQMVDDGIAGLVANASSGTVYLDGNGTWVDNLGVHEHWNNPVDKQYSRNLGEEVGIELVRINE